MAAAIDYEALVAMLHAAAAKVVEQTDELGRLDAFAGDGDHGTTMKTAMGVLVQAVAGNADRSLAALLKAVGWELMGVDGGCAPPLLGSLFNGMAKAAKGLEALDSAALAAVFEAGLASLAKQSKANVGDKTMMDALVPAVGAMTAGAAAGQSPGAMLAAAAAAAEAGAAATTTMQARFGRARNLGERSIGAADAGATSMSLIFRGFADAVGQGA